MLSQCCEQRVLKARSSSGWYINGVLTFEWLECSSCKQTCEALSENETQGESEHDEGIETGIEN